MKITALAYLVSLLLFFGCTERSKKIVLPLNTKISTLDPQKSYDLVSSQIIYQVYEPLYQYNYLKRPYLLEPLLAAELPQISKNKKIYRITIKKNILYHSQNLFIQTPRYVTADDFIMGIKRLAFKKTNSKGWWLLQGKIKGLDRFRSQVEEDVEKLLTYQVEGLKKIDEHTFEIHLTQRFSQIIHLLAMAFTVPVPAEIIKKFSNDISNIDIGTGPYYFSDPTQISHQRTNFELTSNKHYLTSRYPNSGDRIANNNKMLTDSNKKLPLNQVLELSVVPDEDERWKLFLQEELDIADVPLKLIPKILNTNGNLKKEYVKKGIQLHVSSSLIFWWLAFNMRDPILGKNLYLRKAIAHAIDRKKYIKKFAHNTGQIANSIYPPGILGYGPASDLPYQYDINKAKELMKKAGFPEGKGLPTILFDTRKDGEKNLEMAKFIKSSLKKIGIEVKIIVNNFTQFLEKAKKAKMQFWQGGWLMDYPDPENILQLLYSHNKDGGPNKTGFTHSKFDQLYHQYLLEIDSEQKEVILAKLEKIVNEQQPWIMLHYTINYFSTRKKLKNFRYSDLIFNYPKYLRK